MARSAPAARKPWRSYSEAASTITGTPRAWQIAAELGQRDLAVLHRVVRDDVERGGRALADRASSW